MKNLAVFASGSGTNFEAIAQACADGKLNAKVVLMVCDKPGAKVIERAQRFGIESLIFNPKDYANKAAYETLILNELQAKSVDLICLAGYMRIVGDTLLNAYPDKIINIHPSLLPSFRGAHAVEDAVAYGVKVYGIIIAQRAFAYDGNDPAEVHRLGQVIEHQLYVDVLQELTMK